VASQLVALEKQLVAVGISDIWAAEIEMCRGLAALLDENPDPFIWREYRQALKAFREVLNEHDTDPSQDLDAEWDALGGPPVRDTEES